MGTQCGYALYHASAELRNDKEVVLAALISSIKQWKEHSVQSTTIEQLLAESHSIPTKVTFQAVMYGLPWNKGMNLIIQKNPSALENISDSTGLLPFMACASNEDCDLSTLFEI